MRMHLAFVVLQRAAVTCVLVLGLGVATAGDARSPVAYPKITVFADYYVLAGSTFDDLNLLEKHVIMMHPRRLSLVACGSDVPRSLKAAVHRFPHVALEIRVVEPEERKCSGQPAVAIPVSYQLAQRPRGIDDETVERYWLDLMP
jgi:hypothetical protein